MPEQPTFLICPYCNNHHDLKKILKKGHNFQPTDYSLCIKCAEVSIFTEELNIRKMEFDDWMEMQAKGLFDQVDRAQKLTKLRLSRNPPTENETSFTETPL